jgi:ribosomal protein L21
MIKLAMENQSNTSGNEPDITIIQFGNKQKIVRKNQIIEIDHLPDGKTGDTIDIPGFSVSNTGKYLEIKIPVRIVEPTYLGEKIKIVKKKRRARYRRTIGFRAKLTLVEVL